MVQYGAMGSGEEEVASGSSGAAERRPLLKSPRRGQEGLKSPRRAARRYASGRAWESDTGVPGRSLDDYMSGYDTLDSDVEGCVSAPEQVPITANLPNAAPAPYVYLGFACAVLAGICFTSSNVMVKFVPLISSWQLLFVRCTLQLFAMIPLIWVSGENMFGTPDFATRWRVAAQGILGGILLLVIFEAVARVPLGDCTAIFFSSPAFTMILSFFILKDHCGLWRFIVAGVLLSGVVILSRPPSLFPSSDPRRNTTEANSTLDNSTDHHDHGQNSRDDGYDLVGLLCCIAQPILSAWIVIITRQAKHVHYSILVFWFAVGGEIVAVVGVLCLDEKPLFQDWEAKEWVLSFMVALVGILGSMLMTKAVCWVTPSKVMVVRSFEVVAAYLLQVTVFHDPTHLSDVGGTALIVAAVLGMGLEDPLMDRLKWRFL